MRPRNFPFEQHIFHLGPRPATTSLRVNSAFEDPAKIWAAKPPKRPTHRHSELQLHRFSPRKCMLCQLPLRWKDDKYRKSYTS
jgi:hypothetical protein